MLLYVITIKRFRYVYLDSRVFRHTHTHTLLRAVLQCTFSKLEKKTYSRLRRDPISIILSLSSSIVIITIIYYLCAKQLCTTAADDNLKNNVRVYKNVQ